MRTSIENYIHNLAKIWQENGLYKAIQTLLFGNNRNVCPRGCKW